MIWLFESGLGRVVVEHSQAHAAVVVQCTDKGCSCQMRVTLDKSAIGTAELVHRMYLTARLSTANIHIHHYCVGICLNQCSVPVHCLNPWTRSGAPVRWESPWHTSSDRVTYEHLSTSVLQVTACCLLMDTANLVHWLNLAALMNFVVLVRWASS